MMLSSLSALGALLAVLVNPVIPEPESTSTSSANDSWPQWRGPTRDGQFSGPTWPSSLDPGSLELVWRVENLGPSYCGPILSETHIFTAETRNKQDEVVQAFDRTTGELVWESAWSGAMKVPFFAAKNGSWIRSTPAFDGAHLYIAGMRDVLVCLDAGNGEEVWKIDFIDQYGTPNPDFGFVSSPLVTDKHVYVQAGAAICKLDKADGTVLWRAGGDGGGMWGSAFSSPVLTRLNDRDQLVVLSRTHMIGLDPESGDVLWSQPVKAFRGMNILTPMIHDEGVFTSTYGGRTQLLDVTPGEESSKVTSRWNNRLQGYMTSPVIIEGHAYFFTRSNRFASVNLSDGEINWISPPTGDDYWSLLAQGDRILALNDTGELRLIKADPESYEVIDTRRVSDQATWAHVGAAGQQLVIREQNALSVYRWK